MNSWVTFDLTSKTMKQLVDNMHLLKKMFDNKKTVELFFNRFPFEKLMNMTVMDNNNISLSIEIVHFLSDYDEFYNFNHPFNYSMEFILINLSQVTRDCKEIFSLFHLLSKILHNNLTSIDTSFKNMYDRERILEVMLKVAKFDVVDKCNFMYYGPILKYLLEQNFPDSIHVIVSELFVNLKKHGALSETAIICNQILRRFKTDCDTFQNIYEWLTESSPEILAEYHNEDLLLEVVNCLTNFVTMCDYMKNVQKCKSSKIVTFYSKKLYKNLLKVSADICLQSSNPKLRLNCIKLLEFTLVEFFEEEKLPYVTKYHIAKEVNELPEDVEKWPESKCDIFLSICHMTVWYSRLIWKEQDVLSALIQCFYARKYCVRTYVLKSLYFLFPVLVNCSDNDTRSINFHMRSVGDDLLTYFKKFSSASYLYSYNSHQLRWMLTRGSKSLKLTVLCQWMNTLGDDEVLASAIRTCKAESTLLELLLDHNIAQKMGPKLALLLRKMNNVELSRDIAMMLPLTVDKPVIFCNLLLSDPAVPLDSNDSELICALMGAITPTLKDPELLKRACTFSSKLLASLKNNQNAIKAFCKNVSNIHHLIEITQDVDDTTSIEIIRLLKVIIIVQQRNKAKFEENIQKDLRLLINGSLEKVEKSLKLLYHILSSKHSLIAMDESSVFGIYYMLLDYSTIPTLHDLVYDCVVSLLRRMPWLTQTVSSSIHIEMSCLTIYDSEHVKSFLKMLDTWLTTLRKEPYNGFCFIPEKLIKSFVSRASLSKFRIQEYNTILNELMKKHHLQVRGDGIYSRN